jgi:hypothetical protein
MKRGSFKKGDTPAKECGVHAGRMILAKYVELMPYEEKVTTAAAVDARDEHHPFCIASGCCWITQGRSQTKCTRV